MIKQSVVVPQMWYLIREAGMIADHYYTMQIMNIHTVVEHFSTRSTHIDCTCSHAHTCVCTVCVYTCIYLSCTCNVLHGIIEDVLKASKMSEWKH